MYFWFHQMQNKKEKRKKYTWFAYSEKFSFPGIENYVIVLHYEVTDTRVLIELMERVQKIIPEPEKWSRGRFNKDQKLQSWMKLYRPQ